MKNLASFVLLLLAFPLFSGAQERGGETYKFGVAATVSLDGTEIWVGHAVVGSNLFPAQPGVLTAVSSSTEDDVGGSGSTRISIEGIYAEDCDIGFPALRVVEVDLDGTSSVAADAALPGCWFRVNRVSVVSGGDNAGRLDVLIGSETVAIIDIGIGQTEQAMLSVIYHTAIKEASADLLSFSGQSPAMVIKLFSRKWGGARRVRIKPMVVTEEEHSAQENVDGVEVEANSDIWMEVFDVISGGGMVTAHFLVETF